MIRYVLKRLALFAVILFLVHVLTFVLINFLDLRGPMAFGYVPDTEVPLNVLGTSYIDYLRSLSDPLVSTAAFETISDGILRSLILLTVAMVFALIVGIPLGFMSVSYRHRRANPLALVASLAGFSMPGFYVSIVAFFIMLQVAISRGSGAFILPVSGYGLDTHLVLPVLALAARPTAEFVRLTAEFLVEELPKDYVRTARAKGLPWRLVILRHAGRNIAGAVFTTVGNSLSYLIGALVIIELAFDWGGIGHALINSISFNEFAGSSFNPAQAAALATALALLFLIADLVTELSAQSLDPRLRRNTGA